MFKMQVYIQIRNNFHYAEPNKEIGIEGGVKGIPQSDIIREVIMQEPGRKQEQKER